MHCICDVLTGWNSDNIAKEGVDMMAAANITMRMDEDLNADD